MKSTEESKIGLLNQAGVEVNALLCGIHWVEIGKSFPEMLLRRFYPAIACTESNTMRKAR